MLRSTLVLILFLNAFIQMIRADYYSSIAGLEKLLKLENLLIENLEAYINAEEQRQSKLIKYVDEKENEMEVASKGFKAFYENPLNNCKSIRRVRQLLEDINVAKLYNHNSQEFFERIKQHEKQFPNKTDLLGAAKGIARLQKIYNLETLDLANGIILNRKVSLEMSIEECFSLVTILIDARIPTIATIWLMAALRRQKEKMQSKFSQLELDKIMENLAHAEWKNGNPKQALLLLNDLISRNANNAKVFQTYQLIEKDLKEQRIAKESMEMGSKDSAVEEPSPILEMYEKTCNGQLKRTAREERDLYCRYSHNNVPFCFIAPFKVEILNFDPYVAIYYEAIYEIEIQNILKNATQKVKRSTTGNTEKDGKVSDYRTSKQAWLDFRKHTFLAPLLQRLTDITGLSNLSAEEIQVANYGIGGQFGPHFDFFTDKNFSFHGWGNRMLTALFYINEVEMGGSTAFPYLKLAVPPIRRSLVMWYNLHSSLDPDYRTLHAGCPVIKGSKWILNEWFHTLHQEFNRPCGLERDNYKSEKFRRMKSFKPEEIL